MVKLPEDIGLRLQNVKSNDKLTYRALTEVCGIQYSTSQGQRRALINQLSLYCNIHQNPDHTYSFDKIYDTKLIAPIHKNNRFQRYIDSAILQCFKSNNLQKLYLTNIEILELTAMVNPNFKVVCSPVLAAKLDDADIQGLQDDIWVVYHILHNWVEARLDSMEARGLLLKRTGFRLYRKVVMGEYEYTLHMDVPVNSALEKTCLEIYRRAVVQCGLGHNWDGSWLPQAKYQQFRETLNRLTKKAFADDSINPWERMKMITVLDPLENMRLIDDEIEDINRALDVLNNESQRKIESTRQLDHTEPRMRRKIVDELIDLGAGVNYMAQIKE